MKRIGIALALVFACALAGAAASDALLPETQQKPTKASLREAGDQLTVLLKDHINIAVEVIKAAKAGNKAGLTAADAKWQKNGEDIADFLSKANPNWPRATLVDMMKTHLSTTTAEVTARLNKDWAADVRAFDEVYRHILMMSDALADGIVKQFPAKFAG